MKKAFLSIASILFVFLSFAQNSSEAKAILDKTYANYENSKGVKISFSFSAVENSTVHQQQKGTAMVKGNKFKIEMSGIDTWFDGKTQWVLMKDFNEVNISEPTPEELASISPIALLNIYKTGFTLKAPKSQTIGNKDVAVIDMTPTGTKSDFKDISMAIDKSNFTIVQVLLTLKNGLRNKIDITEYNTNFNFNDSDFLFNRNKYPGVEIIDLR